MLTICMLMMMCVVTAFAADKLPDADKSGVITLTEDVTISSDFPTSGTIDLNGHTLTYTGSSSITIAKGSELTIKDNTGDGELVLTSGITGVNAYLTVDGTLNLEDITVSSSGCVIYAQGTMDEENPATVNVESCEISTTGVYCIATNATQINGVSQYSPVDITIKDSIVMTEATDGDDCTVMINVDGSLTIENSYIVGDRQAVVVRAGDATITDSTLIVTGEDNTTSGWKDYTGDGVTWGSGNEFPSAALLVGSYNGTYYGDAEVTVENSTIASLSDDSAAIYAESNKEVVSGATDIYTSTVTLTGDDTVVTGKVETGKATTTDEKTGETVSASTIAISGGTYDTDVSTFQDDSVVAVLYAADGTTSYFTTTSAAAEALAKTGEGSYVEYTESANTSEGKTYVKDGVTYTYYSTLKVASCAESGVDKYVAKDGTSTYVAVAPTHSWDGGVVTTAATCTETGVITYTCTNPDCPNITEDETTGDDVAYTKTVTTAALGHTASEEETYTDADCETNIQIVHLCTVCGEVADVVQEVEGTALGHDYTYDVAVDEITKEATCTEDGEMTVTCKRDGCCYGEKDEEGNPTAKTETVTIEATGHTWSEEEVRDADCEYPDRIGKVCTVCGAEEFEAVEGGDEAKGHTWVLKEVSATCEEDGYYYYECSDCSKTTDEETGTIEIDGEEVEAYGVIPASEDYHSYETADVLRNGDCYTTRVEKQTCEYCGDTKYMVTGLNHTWDNGEVIQDANCGKNETTKYTCTICGATTEKITAEATGKHDYQETVIGADCQTLEHVAVVCTVCGDVQKEYEPIEGAVYGDHVMDEDTVEMVDATCTEDGTLTYTCEVCGATITETINATGHTWDNGVIVPVTCEEDEHLLFTCEVCGATYTQAIEDGEKATGTHEWETKKVEATCGHEGYTYQECTICGTIVIDEDSYTEIDPDNHEWVEDTVLRFGTCGGQTSIIKYVCANGDGAYKYAAVAVEHSYDYDNPDSSEITKEPTCTEEGEVTNTYTYAVCGAETTTTETIEALGHTPSEEKLSEDGTYVYTECTVCGEILSKEYLDHDHVYDEGVVTEEATCTEDGEKTYTCTICGESYTEVVPAVGHTSGEVTIENYVAPTATEAGSYDEVTHCVVCDIEISRETIEIPATGETHTYEASLDMDSLMEDEYGDVYATVTLTCTDEGCEETWTSDPVLVTSETTAPTCTEPGETVITATVTYEGVEYTATGTVELDPLGHEYDDGVITKAATCTEDGIITYTCGLCGDTYTETVPATGHNYVLTYDEETDTYQWTCSECGAVR